MTEHTPTVVRLQVNDPDTADAYVLRLKGEKHDLVTILNDMSEDSFQYLKEAVADEMDTRRDAEEILSDAL